jgi:hypothetical protein
MSEGIITAIITGIFSLLAVKYKHELTTPTSSSSSTKDDFNTEKDNEETLGIYVLSVVLFAFYYVPKFGWIKGLLWSSIALFYWIYYKGLWLCILKPLFGFLHDM